MAKRALISGYIGFNNFGDEAVLSVLANHLKSQGAIVRALSSNPEGTQKTHNIKAFRYKNIFDILRSIFWCDVLFSGGGSILQNFTSNLNLFYYLFIIFLALLTGKKVVIFAQGIGPIKGTFSPFITKLILRRCHLISTRDTDSQHTLRRWGVHSKLVCDPVWTLQTYEYKPEPIVGVQLRPYAAMNRRFLERLAKGISLHFSDKKIQIFSFQNEFDTPKCYEFQGILKSISPEINSEVIIRGQTDDVLKDFSKLEYLIAMRFHACLLGLKYGIKTLPVSYDQKIEALARELDLKIIHAHDDADFTEALRELLSYEENVLVKQKRKITFDWGPFDAILGNTLGEAK